MSWLVFSTLYDANQALAQIAIDLGYPIYPTNGETGLVDPTATPTTAWDVAKSWGDSGAWCIATPDNTVNLLGIQQETDVPPNPPPSP